MRIKPRRDDRDHRILRHIRRIKRGGVGAHAGKFSRSDGRRPICRVRCARRISRILGTSSYYLSNVFSAETGISLKGYLNQMRIEAAKWLLAKTGEKLETIALRVGLHDASHLSRLFLRHTGDRPGAYRRHQAGTAR